MTDIMATKHDHSALANILVGRKIVEVRYLDDEEAEDLGWDDAAIVLVLDDGTRLYPSRDSEGNGPGVLFGDTITGASIWAFPRRLR